MLALQFRSLSLLRATTLALLAIVVGCSPASIEPPAPTANVGRSSTPSPWPSSPPPPLPSAPPSPVPSTTPSPTAPPSPIPPSTPTTSPSPAPLLPPTPAASARRIVGYYPSWSIYQRDYQVANIPASKLTHINYAFAKVDGDSGECDLGDIQADDANFRHLADLKQEYPHLKVLISVGGGGSWSADFSDVALTDASRKGFVRSCIDLFLAGQYEGIFDGIDVDWEYPVSGGEPNNTARPEDKQNYTLLLQEFRRQLDAREALTGQHHLLTIAAPAGPSVYANLELQDIGHHLDWINLMAYDFHGGWEGVANFNAALYPSSGDPAPAYLNAHAAAQAYLGAGVPPDKLVLGVPFYGRGWAGVPDVQHGLYQPASELPRGTWEHGIFEYKDLAGNYVDMNGYTRYWHDEAKVPWLYNPSTETFITYDDPQSLGIKADYVVEQGLGGVMFWELSADDGALLDTLYARLLGMEQ